MTQSPPRGELTAGVLHPGQMGAAVAAAAVNAGARVLWCPLGRSRTSVERARAAGLHPAADLAELVAASEVVLSICPPAAAEDLASAVAAQRFHGVFVEANAISRERVRRIAGQLERAGARVVDGAIIGPPPVGGPTARLYLAGSPGDVATVAGLFAPRPVEVVTLRGGVGSASTLKMAFASYQKATRSLAAVAHALAARHGVTEALLAEAERMTGSPLAEPDYLPSVAARAWRWAPEMREVADALTAEGLPDDLALAAAAILERWEPDRDRWDITLSGVLDRLRAAGPVAG